MTSFVQEPGIAPGSRSLPPPLGRRPSPAPWRRPLVLALLCVCTPLWAEPSGLSALGAVKLLPKGASGKIAIIAAQEGKPAPERWYILVHDSADENGLHEYVIANGEVVASRSVSQFAEELKTEDVIGADAIKIDSDRAVKVVQHYAAANQLAVEAYNYELKKGGKDAAPIWHVTCLNPKGEQIGQVVLTATKGTVLSHDGFKVAPADAATEAEEERKHADEEKKHAEEERRRGDEEKRRAEVKKPVTRTSAAVATPTARPKLLERVGGGLKNLFGGGNRD